MHTPHDALDRQGLLARVEALTRALADSEASANRAAIATVVAQERQAGQREALERNLDWYADLFNHAPIAYLALDGAGLIHDVNDAAVALLASDRPRLLGWPLHAYLAPHGRRRFLDALVRLRHGPGPVHEELPLLTAHGREIPVAFLSRRSTVNNDGGLSFCTALFDLRERTRARDDLHTVAGALLRVEANERRELASLLHDDLGQRLVAARLQLAALARTESPPEFGPLLAILADAHQVVRSLAFQLSPPILHELGLVAALRWLTREMLARYGLRVEFSAEGELPPLAPDTRYLLFRSVRELLLNVVKHAASERASLVIRSHAAGLEITVTDAGRGFDPESPGPAHDRSFGLLSTRERLHAAGARLVITSRPGHGTRAHLLLPTPTPAAP